MSIEEMTIDETIDGLRDQMGFGDPVLINAILHLKAYKENNPLTWEDLKSMERKPVWVEVYDPIDEKTGWHTASWKLIEFINDEYFDVRDSDGEQECFYKSENDWQAYKKERK